MKKIILPVIFVVGALTLAGCTTQTNLNQNSGQTNVQNTNSQQSSTNNGLSKDEAIRLLTEANCIWTGQNTARKDVKVELQDSDWVMSVNGCGGECKINSITKEIYLDSNPMCTGVKQN